MFWEVTFICVGNISVGNICIGTWTGRDVNFVIEVDLPLTHREMLLQWLLYQTLLARLQVLQRRAIINRHVSEDFIVIIINSCKKSTEGHRPPEWPRLETACIYREFEALTKSFIHFIKHQHAVNSTENIQTSRDF